MKKLGYLLAVLVLADGALVAVNKYQERQLNAARQPKTIAPVTSEGQKQEKTYRISFKVSPVVQSGNH